MGKKSKFSVDNLYNEKTPSVCPAFDTFRSPVGAGDDNQG
jgi:hypothetical protein